MLTWLGSSGRLPGNHQLPYWLRRRIQDSEPVPSSDPQVRNPTLALIEAALFAADEPLTMRRLAQVTGIPKLAEMKRWLDQLQDCYDRNGSAFKVSEVAGGYQLLTRPEYHFWVRRLCGAAEDLRLSSAAWETLAIVAYRQPVMRADIEAIRGVQCGELLRQLMDKGLLRIVGRHDSLGRPVLYGTTRRFLQALGLNHLEDLPRAGEFSRRAPDSINPPKTNATDNPQH
jgi:segregation and condensation protein B